MHDRKEKDMGLYESKDLDEEDEHVSDRCLPKHEARYRRLSKCLK